MHQVRGAITKAMLKQSQAARALPLAPRPQWMRDEQPDLSDDEADATWRIGTQRLFGEVQHLFSHPDASSFTGGNTLKVTAEIHHSARGPRHVKIALDTQSDVTTCLRAYLMDVHPIIPDEVNGIGGSSVFTEEGTLHVWSEPRQERVALPALVAPEHLLPAGCVALLGVPIGADRT
jgi:hypothetical protein